MGEFPCTIKGGADPLYYSSQKKKFSSFYKFLYSFLLIERAIIILSS